MVNIFIWFMFPKRTLSAIIPVFRCVTVWVNTFSTFRLNAITHKAFHKFYLVAFHLMVFFIIMTMMTTVSFSKFFSLDTFLADGDAKSNIMSTIH